MKLFFSEEINLFSEAVLLLARRHIAGRMESVWSKLSEQGHTDTAEWKKRTEMVREPLTYISEEARAVYSASQAMDDFYFKPVFDDSISTAIVLSIGERYAETLGKTLDMLSEEELCTARFVMLSAVSDLDLPADPQKADLDAAIGAAFDTDTKCWAAARILYQPQKYYMELKQLLLPVIAVLEQHRTELEGIARAHMKILQKKSETDKQYFSRSMRITEEKDLNLRISCNIMWPESMCFYTRPGFSELNAGVFYDLLFTEETAKLTGDALAEALKALADKRRMEILHLLRIRPHYAQEISEKLGITPATVNHHMQALLAQSVVNMEQGQRVMYGINEKTVLRILNGIRSDLLGKHE